MTANSFKEYDCERPPDDAKQAGRVITRETGSPCAFSSSTMYMKRINMNANRTDFNLGPLRIHRLLKAMGRSYPTHQTRCYLPMQSKALTKAMVKRKKSQRRQRDLYPSCQSDRLQQGLQMPI